MLSPPFNVVLTCICSTASRFSALLIPSCPGALHDLAENEEMAVLLNRFIEQKSNTY